MDSARSAGLVCGSWTPMAHAPDLAALNVDLRPVTTGSGNEVLGTRPPGRPTLLPPTARH
ncbi:hypothetical protein [Streptomyces sp. NPDC057509]|uniref:hypothetical protein n=1 Tax=Streptomyces sp. NPDC057509 TaxID=3346152 RepID=UPI0036C7674A